MCLSWSQAKKTIGSLSLYAACVVWCYLDHMDSCISLIAWCLSLEWVIWNAYSLLVGMAIWYLEHCGWYMYTWDRIEVIVAIESIIDYDTILRYLDI